ncbi:alpha/beta hydrolase [Cohnella hashimotonis]|uniref:Alpha/beta hydrolase n=1 Tax=Cohnella hashimotonis TaxID=2826895 RepID=A0ABT6TTG1_9BACL|nr:alpha/beta hydrolase [Cohnella hashimotonis]MDI4650149.1 alpha/beta hydrolase [Cohnella hashimotonis]
MTQVVLWCVVAACAVLALALALVCLYLYRVAIARSSKGFLGADPSLPENEASSWHSAAAWYAGQPFELVEITSFDGLKLRAHYLPAADASHRAVVLAHGYSGQGEDMAAFAREYHAAGYHVLMPDARGHGHSEGRYIGFGWHERKDYARWIGELVRRVGTEAQIVLHGISMGGATVLMTSGETLPPQVKCIVSDCAYSSVKDILAYQLRRMYKLPPFPLLPLTSLVCRLRAGYFFGEASVVRQVSKAQRPILFIHGASDTFVPTEMVHKLHDAAAPPDKPLLIVPGAQHGSAYTTDPEAYKEEVLAFLSRHLSPETVRMTSSGEV